MGPGHNTSFPRKKVEGFCHLDDFACLKIRMQPFSPIAIGGWHLKIIEDLESRFAKGTASCSSPVESVEPE